MTEYNNQGKLSMYMGISFAETNQFTQMHVLVFFTLCNTTGTTEFSLNIFRL
jgi:hypothetical protein